MQFWIMPDLNDPSKNKIEQRSSGAGAICSITPELAAEGIEALDIVDEIDELSGEVIGKKAVLNASKKSAANAARASKEASVAQDLAERAAARSRLNAIDLTKPLANSEQAIKDLIRMFR